MPRVRSPPRSHGEAKGAWSWPCLPVAFQDFWALCQLGSSWGSPPILATLDFLCLLERQQKGRTIFPFLFLSSASHLCTPHVPSCPGFLWEPHPPDPAFWSGPGSRIAALGIFLTSHIPFFVRFCSP